MGEKKDCRIVMDLLPNYIEKLTTVESNNYIEEHLKQCSECSSVLESMQKDLNLNSTKIDKREVKYIKKYSKKMKILKTVLILIVLIFIAIVGRNMIIFSRLQNKISKYSESTNYYVKTLTYEGETNMTVQCYVKGDKYLLNMTRRNEEGAITKLTNYFNGTTSNTYMESGNEKIALLNSNGLPSKTSVVNYIDTNNFWQLLLMSVFSSAKSVECNGRDCYYIGKSFSPNILFAEGKNGVYIDKETGLPIRAFNGTVVNNNGDIFDIIVDYKYEFNTVTEEDLKEPNIQEYVIQENN